MSPTRIRVVAALVVRNERPFLGNCLRHLIENGIDYVIVDNGSTDETIELLQQSYFAKHLISYRTHPYQGYMDWEDLMQARQAAADAVDADWILYVSADEIMHSYNVDETLSAAIERVDAAGFDVIDFNEFVFLPIETNDVPDREGSQLLRYYYFLGPTAAADAGAKETSSSISRRAWRPHIGRRALPSIAGNICLASLHVSQSNPCL